MSRPSKLTPAQWVEVDRRLAAGEGVRAVAAVMGVSPATISTRGVSKQSKRVQEVARQVADAQSALAELPVAQQYVAVSLADKLRNISESMASGAELGAKNYHRLNSMANTELQKVDDANIAESEGTLKIVAGLQRMANEAAATPVNLLAANKDRLKPPAEGDDPDKPKGVLVVPGLMADSAAWSTAAQANQPKQPQE